MVRIRDKFGRWPAVEHISIACHYCGKVMQLAPWQASRRPGQNKFCSKECTYKGREVTKTFEIGHPPLVSKEAYQRAATNISKSLKGRKLSAAHCAKISANKRGKKLAIEHIKKALARRPMSSLELKFNDIVLKHNLPYKFVGNGSFFIERRNPDFVNINGAKIAVEVYCRKHKNEFRGGHINWLRNRRYLFGKYGWKILFFHEAAITEHNVLRRLGGSNRD